MRDPVSMDVEVAFPKRDYCNWHMRRKGRKRRITLSITFFAFVLYFFSVTCLNCTGEKNYNSDKEDTQFPIAYRLRIVGNTKKN